MRRYVDHGSVEGTFDCLVYPGTVATNDVIEFISNNGFDDDGVPVILGDHLDEFYRNLGRRGGVTGSIYYRPWRGIAVPTLIIVESLYVFPPDDELPTADDVRGIFSR